MHLLELGEDTDGRWFFETTHLSLIGAMPRAGEGTPPTCGENEELNNAGECVPVTGGGTGDGGDNGGTDTDNGGTDAGHVWLPSRQVLHRDSPPNLASAVG